MTDKDYENMSAFSCGFKELDDFFRYEVKECVDRKYLSAYCAFTESDGIMAAFTLMNDAIMIDSEDEKTDFFDDLRLEASSSVVDFFKRQSSFAAICEQTPFRRRKPQLQECSQYRGQARHNMLRYDITNYGETLIVIKGSFPIKEILRLREQRF